MSILQTQRYLVAVTSEMGAGKSTFLEKVKALGYPVIDTDKLAHEAYEPGRDSYKKLLAIFPTVVDKPDGPIVRSRLAEIIFADPAKKKELEDIVHPAVEALKNERIAKALPGSIVFVEVPVLFECNLQSQYHETLAILIQRDKQIERIQKRSGFSVDHIMARLNKQMPQDQKKKLATNCIDNSGTPAEYEANIEAFLIGVQSRAKAFFAQVAQRETRLHEQLRDLAGIALEQADKKLGHIGNTAEKQATASIIMAVNSSSGDKAAKRCDGLDLAVDIGMRVKQRAGSGKECDSTPGKACKCGKTGGTACGCKDPAPVPPAPVPPAPPTPTPPAPTPPAPTPPAPTPPAPTPPVPTPPVPTPPTPTPPAPTPPAPPTPTPPAPPPPAPPAPVCPVWKRPWPWCLLLAAVLGGLLFVYFWNHPVGGPTTIIVNPAPVQCGYCATPPVQCSTCQHGEAPRPVLPPPGLACTTDAHTERLSNIPEFAFPWTPNWVRTRVSTWVVTYDGNCSGAFVAARDSAGNLLSYQRYGERLAFAYRYDISNDAGRTQIDRIESGNIFAGRTVYTYDEHGRLKSAQLFDGRQRLITDAQFSWTGDALSASTRQFDPDSGRVLSAPSYDSDTVRGVLAANFYLFDTYRQ